MPSITIDNQGNNLYYEDTGAPQNSESLYTTLIIVHGTGFHGREYSTRTLLHSSTLPNFPLSEIFRRLLPLAAQHNLRLVLINRRDYPHSSPYTEEDLDKVRVNNIDTHTEFSKARGTEFAQFIKVFVERENLPRA